MHPSLRDVTNETKEIIASGHLFFIRCSRTAGFPDRTVRNKAGLTHWLF